jgi:hypothetical protein
MWPQLPRLVAGSDAGPLWRELYHQAATRPYAVAPAVLEVVATDDGCGEVMATEERGLLIRRA